MQRRKIKDNVKMHPVMSLMFMVLGVIILSGILTLINFSFTYSKINISRLEYISTTESIINLFSLHGLKYIFATTVSNFANFKILANLIIMLLGIGVMESSGFLETALGLLTRKAKKKTVTYVIILISLISSIAGDLPFLALIPISALIFKYGKRNPCIGIISSFAALTCGYGLSIFFTSIDSSLANLTTLSASILDSSFTFKTFSLVLFMLVSIIILSFVLTEITEGIIVRKVPKYEFDESKDKDFNPSKLELKSLIFAIFASIIYLLIIIYNIIPGLPLSGNFLNYRESLYIDKLFGENSFFSNGFVFIIAMLFVIWGLVYGIVSKKIKTNRDFIECLGSNLNGIGKTMVYIFAGATFISIFKYSNIGNTIVAGLTNLVVNSNFKGLALVILFYLCSIVATIFVPSSLSKWAIMSGSIVPTFLNAGMSAEFAQLVFRLGECASLAVTPLFSYFIIYLAFLEKYTQSEKDFTIGKAMSYTYPYALITSLILLALIIIWFVIGLPLGAGGYVFL